MIKTYILNAKQNNASLILTGKSGNSVRYNFTGGNIMLNTPPSFASENPYYQNLLEESELFKTGKVSLRYTANAAKTPAKLQPVNGVRDARAAIEWCADNLNEKATTGRRALELARKAGFYFPEYDA